jgi:hypothetical protein
MREQLLNRLREQKQILEEKVMNLAADDRWGFERDYFVLTSQHFVINDLIEAILKGEFDNDNSSRRP